MSDGIARFKDFTGDTDPIQFKIRDEVFTAFDDIPLKHMGRLSELGEDLTEGDGDMAGKLLAVFGALLKPESFTRFEAAVNGDSDTVIGIGHIRQIIPWLLEQYGLRPTKASPGSGDTLSESGASLTDGAQLEESILPTSLQSVGSI